MILLGILFFAIGGISGYQIVNSFYSYPINNELTNEIYYLEAEILKKEEEELAIKKETEKEKINKQNKPTKETITFNEIPDPIIDSLLITTLTYVFYGFLAFKMIVYISENENLNTQPLFVKCNIFLVEKIRRLIDNKIACEFLDLGFFSLFPAFFVKITLSLFSSLVFGVHDFWWNLSESYNLVFYLKRGFFGILAFILNIVIFCVTTILFNNNRKNHQNNQNILLNNHYNNND